TLFGVLFGIGMSGLLWKAMKSLKKFEKIGVAIVLGLLIAIFFMFFSKIEKLSG
ncbi:unnamed protein product, partial [marine sediment metagenome]